MNTHPINPATTQPLRTRIYDAARWIALTATVVISVATLAASDRDDQDDRNGNAYAIGLWGDLPYSELQDSGVVNLIKDMNAQSLAFTVHDGDLKQGNGLPYCDDAMYAKSLGYFDSLVAPAMFTPGDNDWTDCDRPNNGGFDSLDRLSRAATLFQRRVLAGTAQASPAGAGRTAVPRWLERQSLARRVRRESALDGWPGHLRYAKHPGQLQ